MYVLPLTSDYFLIRFVSSFLPICRLKRVRNSLVVSHFFILLDRRRQKPDLYMNTNIRPIRLVTQMLTVRYKRIFVRENVFPFLDHPQEYFVQLTTVDPFHMNLGGPVFISSAPKDLLSPSQTCFFVRWCRKRWWQTYTNARCLRKRKRSKKRYTI